MKSKDQSTPCAGIMRCKGTVSSEPHVSPAARVKEYPNEPLTSGKLFCKACKELITVSIHVNMLE